MKRDDPFERYADRVESAFLKKFSSWELTKIYRRRWLDSTFQYFEYRLTGPPSGKIELLVEAARIPEDEFPERLSISVTAFTKGGIFLLQGLHGAPSRKRCDANEYIEKIVSDQTLIIASFHNGQWRGSRTANVTEFPDDDLTYLTDGEIVRSWTGKFDIG